MKLFRSHGISRDKSEILDMPENEIWNYSQTHLGFNYRIPDLNCALGINQLKRIDEFVEKRNLIAKRYDEAFKNSIIIPPFQNKYTSSSYHLYPIRVDCSKNNKGRNFIYSELKKRNIGVNIHYIPVYRHKYYESKGFYKGYCLEAEKFFQEEISIPIFPDLTLIEQDFVIDSIFEILDL